MAEEKMNKREVGAHYEKIAADYLKEKGYTILEKNYRNRFGEIDIIACKENIIVYCEVKFRSSLYSGDPLEAVDVRKQRRISRTALYHYTKYGYAQNVQCRFDVIAIYGDEEIKHIENAFEYQR